MSEAEPSPKKPRFKIQSGFASAWWEAVLAPSFASKFAALLVVVGSVGAVIVSVVGVRRGIDLWRHRPEARSRAAQEQKQLTEFLARQAEDAKEKVSNIELGQFTVEVKGPSNGEGPKGRGVTNMAEIKISIRIEDRDTREFIETHPVLVKNAITSLFAQLDRDDFLTAEGKVELKHRVQNKLNSWLEEEHVSGRIADVYFPSLIVN